MRWRDFDALPPLQPAFFDRPRRVHFVGVGGIGMSALAKLLASRGHQVSGSDANESPALAALRELGIQAVAGHAAANLHLWKEPAEALVFSSAVRVDNPERQEAARLDVPQFHRGQVLAYFVNTAKYSIAVSGTHGKSTTSAMAAHILTERGCNPTAILGAAYSPFGGNLRVGDPDVIVVEADESDGSFTLLHPSVAVVTNIEPEHLENYDDSEAELQRAFRQFTSQATRAVVSGPSSFFVREVEAAMQDNVPAASLLPVPGRHNYENAGCAILACSFLRSGEESVASVGQEARQALTTFKGIARRFEKKGEAQGVAVYDDYAHHPTEVRATLEAARDFLRRPVTVIFQPHRYSRTAQMGRDFGPTFEAADRVIITQLYSAFEEPIAGISGRIVFDALREALPHKEASYANTLDEARQMAVESANTGDVIFTMGAGDVSKLGPLLLQDLSESRLKTSPPEVA